MKKSISVLLAILMVLTMLPFVETCSFAEMPTIKASGFDIYMPTENSSGCIWVTEEYITVGEVIAELKNLSETVRVVTVSHWGGNTEDMNTVCDDMTVFTVEYTDGTTHKFYTAIAQDIPSTDGYDGLYGDYYYNIISEIDKTCEIAEYVGTSTALIIPSLIDGYTVEYISWYAFGNCTSLTSVTVPNSVKSIEADAFYGCDSLTIYGFSGSCAKTYAKEYGYKFVDITPVIKEELVNPGNGYEPELIVSMYLDTQFVTVAEALSTYAEYYNAKGVEMDTIIMLDETGRIVADTSILCREGMCISSSDTNGCLYLCGVKSEDSSMIIGDTDGNGEVDDWDSVLLDRYLAGWNVEFDTSTADIDQNGEVDDWDSVLLARKLAGWDV